MVYFLFLFSDSKFFINFRMRERREKEGERKKEKRKWEKERIFFPPTWWLWFHQLMSDTFSFFSIPLFFLLLLSLFFFLFLPFFSPITREKKWGREKIEWNWSYSSGMNEKMTCFGGLQSHFSISIHPHPFLFFLHLFLTLSFFFSFFSSLSLFQERKREREGRETLSPSFLLSKTRHAG